MPSPRESAATAVTTGVRASVRRASLRLRMSRPVWGRAGFYHYEGIAIGVAAGWRQPSGLRPVPPIGPREIDEPRDDQRDVHDAGEGLQHHERARHGRRRQNITETDAREHSHAQIEELRPAARRRSETSGL